MVRLRLALLLLAGAAPGCRGRSDAPPSSNGTPTAQESPGTPQGVTGAPPTHLAPFVVRPARPPERLPEATLVARPDAPSAPEKIPKGPSVGPLRDEPGRSFEEAVAERTGDWWVVLGSFPTPDDPQRARVEERLRAGGTPYYVALSDDLPRFTPGLVVVVVGPSSQREAARRLRRLRALVPDAYIKAGW